MSKALPEECKQEWRDKIQAQRCSQLPVSVWCRQNNISAHTFSYWQNKLFPKNPLNCNSFTEILQEKKCPGISLECHGVIIHLDPYFDAAVLKRCLDVLRKC